MEEEIICKTCKHFIEYEKNSLFSRELCVKCIHRPGLIDNYEEILNKYICEICGYWWEGKEMKNECPQCHSKNCIIDVSE